MKAIHLVALGNPVMSDDGAGPILTEQLKKIKWQYRLHVHNTGTASLGYRSLLEDNNGFIYLIDALQTGRPPGTVVKLNAGQLRLDNEMYSLHDMHFLHLARRFYPHRLPDIRIYGIEPHSLVPGTNLSEPVRRGLPLLARVLVLDILRRQKALSAVSV